jgi:hypothetical protein
LDFVNRELDDIVLTVDEVSLGDMDAVVIILLERTAGR